MKLYFEADGLFKLFGRMIELVYVTPEKEYRLNGRMDIPYNDIIAYKDAISSGLTSFHPTTAGEGGSMSTRITQYSFGYKNIIQDGDVAFNFKALCKVPAGDSIYMNFRLVSNKAFDGKFQIRVNGMIAREFYAPLEPGIGGELNWVVQ
ncbi:hypothetical protein [Paenibacillus peoriae]|nr:hypothetical protein [Paenibacillus peoriae]